MNIIIQVHYGLGMVGILRNNYQTSMYFHITVGLFRFDPEIQDKFHL